MMRNRQVSMIVNTAGEQILPYAQALVEKGLGIAVKDRKMLSPATERFLEYL